MIAPQLQAILAALHQGGVKFILIGGVAGNVHGSACVTYDLDIVDARDRENIRRRVEVLRPHSPYLRGAPPGLPFVFDEQTVRNGLNFTLITAMGDFDLLEDVAGGGTFEELLAHSETINHAQMTFQCVTLEVLIQLKRAAGRPKDLEMIAELQAILEERKSTGMR